MNILVTAGSTSVPIDKVRNIGNIFRGRTGRDIARAASLDGHRVTLVTSNPEEARGCGARVLDYQTFDQLAELLEGQVRNGGYDAIVHSAAVSDFRVDRVYSRSEDGMAHALASGEAATKISSSYKRLVIECVPTMKLVDQIRKPWGFTGTLVKFKLQVGMSDVELLAIAARSRVASRADIIVANTLEHARDYAYILDKDGWGHVSREYLAVNLVTRLACASSSV